MYPNPTGIILLGDDKNVLVGNPFLAHLAADQLSTLDFEAPELSTQCIANLFLMNVVDRDNIYVFVNSIPKEVQLNSHFSPR